MLRLLLAFAIALASPAPAAFAQPQGGTAAAVDEADALIDELQAEGLIAGSAEKATIEAEVKRQLNRIAQGRSFSSIRRGLEAQIGAAPDLTSEQKDEALAILGDFADQRISREQAASALKQLRARPRPASSSGYSGGFILIQGGGTFVLILVLFILLVIVGAGR